MKKISDLTPEQKAELEALAVLPEEKINTADIPEQRDWSSARRGELRALDDLETLRPHWDAGKASGHAGELDPKKMLADEKARRTHRTRDA